jgi:hypothetical protein
MEKKERSAKKKNCDGFAHSANAFYGLAVAG